MSREGLAVQGRFGYVKNDSQKGVIFNRATEHREPMGSAGTWNFIALHERILKDFLLLTLPIR